jgi:hypothetical protein
MAAPLDCAHCETTGTCGGDRNAQACGACIAFWQRQFSFLKLNIWKPEFSDEAQKGMRCSCCWGRGVTESSSSKYDYRVPALLAGALALLSFGLLAWVHKDTDEFGKAVVFVGTLLGSITGYYFGGEKGKGTADTQANNTDPSKTASAQAESAGVAKIPDAQAENDRAPDIKDSQDQEE